MSDKRTKGWIKDNDTTPDLDTFLVAYAEDDNIWWEIACGHHMNLFDEAPRRGLTPGPYRRLPARTQQQHTSPPGSAPSGRHTQARRQGGTGL